MVITVSLKANKKNNIVVHIDNILDVNDLDRFEEIILEKKKSKRKRGEKGKSE